MQTRPLALRAIASTIDEDGALTAVGGVVEEAGGHDERGAMLLPADRRGHPFRLDDHRRRERGGEQRG